MKYLRLYDHVSEHEADTEHFTENKYSTCYMKEDLVVGYHNNPEANLSAGELTNGGD